MLALIIQQIRGHHWAILAITFLVMLRKENNDGVLADRQQATR